MKRRLLSAFLAVMMVLTMAPVAFAAEEAGNGDTLKKLFTDVKAGESGSGNVTVTIDKDYNLTGYNWTALTVDGYNGAGIVTVEGNNHTITGLNTSLFAGGFAGTSGIVIKDLTLDNVSIEDTTNEQGIGAFINNVDSMPKIELNNCHLTDSTITSTGGARVGGLIGWTSGYNKKDDGPVDTYITVTNCSVENTKITAKGSVGGIIGHAGANPATYHTFTNNTVTGCTLNSTDDGGWRVGVVVGTANVGEVALKNTTESGNTVTQTGKTAPAGQSNLYGRFVPGTTGKLVIDGTAVFDSSIVAVVDNKGYKTLADAVAAAQNGATVKLLANINGQTVIPADKNIVLDLNGKTMTHNIKRQATVYNNGTLTICDSSADKSGKIRSTVDTAICAGNNSNTTIQYANIEAVEGAVITGTNTGATVTIEDGIFEVSDNAVVAGNGTKRDGAANTITINGGTFTGNIQSSGYVACGIYAPWKDNIVVNGGTFNITGGAGIVARGGIVVVNNGEFNTTGNATGKVGDSRVVVPCSALVFDSAAKYPSLTNDSKIQINDGKFKSDVDTIKVVKDDTDMNSRVIVGGGYFTTDPTDYVASGYVAGTSDVSGYSYKVVEKTNTGNVEVKPDVAKPEVKVDKIPQADKEKVAAAAATVSAPTLGAAAADEAQKIDKSKADELVAKANKVTGDKKLYVQSALKVEPTAYDETTKTLALEITPQYRVVASTADTADKIKLDGDTKNAQVVQDYQTMNITKATVVTMELPTGFAVADGDKLSIQHTKNGTVEYYTGTVTKKDDKFYLTFTTNGFSPFVISVPEAAIESKVYPTLQAAVDSAKNDDIIDLYKDVAPDTKVTVAKTIKFKIATNSKKFDAAKNIVAGSNTTVKVTGESSPYIYEFTYTKPSSSSSGGSSSGKTTYKVTTSAVNNGGVNASPSTAEKGATITLTLSPDKGYKLDKLTVTDGSGKSVSTVKKSDTVYTFTMPASAVTVGVSYAKADETPSKTTFNDVSANDWFASAVDYVTGKGMMNGTAANTFSPKANTTRGMLMTVLARHAGEDTTGGSVWYEKGMNWAKANGVSDGTNPQVNITREQLAAMLYRYAQNKKYDVSGAKSLDGYTDAQSVSSYAVPALQWANAAGVVTGKSGSKLDPKGYATRAEVAAMLMRFCENVEK